MSISHFWNEKKLLILLDYLTLFHNYCDLYRYITFHNYISNRLYNNSYTSGANESSAQNASASLGTTPFPVTQWWGEYGMGGEHDTCVATLLKSVGVFKSWHSAIRHRAAPWRTYLFTYCLQFCILHYYNLHYYQLN